MATESPVSRVGASAATSSVRWRYVYPALLVYWIVSVMEKSNIAVVIANHGFLADLGLVGREAQLGLLSTAFVVVYGLAMPVWAWLIDAKGPRWVGFVSVSIWIAATLASGAAQNYTQLLWLRGILGFAEAPAWPLTFAVVARWFPLDERARGQTTQSIGAGLAFVLGGLVVTTLVLMAGWRGQFYGLGIIAAVVLLPAVWLGFRNDPRRDPLVTDAERERISSGPAGAGGGAPRAFRMPTAKGLGELMAGYRFWLLVVIAIANTVFFWGVGAWFPSMLRAADHFNFAQAGYMTSVIWGFVIITLLITSTMSDRRLRRAGVEAVGLLVSGVCLVVGVEVHVLWLSLVLLVLAWCGQQAGFISFEALTHHVVGRDEMAMGGGIIQGIANFIGAFAPAIIGFLVGLEHGSFAGGFLVVGITVAVGAGASAILAFQGY